VFQVRVAAFHEHCEAVMGCYRHVLVTVDGTNTKEQVRHSATLSPTPSIGQPLSAE
jgi:hypothetical protein